MAFFNFRRGSSNPAASAAPAAQPESVEAMRKRAKHRLIGAIVLVLLGVVGFPLLFDTQPRPIAVDIPIEIPGKNSVKPLTLPAQVAVVPAPPASGEKVAAASSLSPSEEILPSKPEKVSKVPEVQEEPVSPAIKKEVKPVSTPDAKSEPADAPKAVEKPQPKPPAKTEIKPESKTFARPADAEDDGARARALLNGTAQPQKAVKPAAAATDGSSRLVVQVGAFADEAKAGEVRSKLEKAGLKTYTQVADTKDGKRTRVRVGPFANRAEADQAVSKIKALGLAAAVLTL